MGKKELEEITNNFEKYLSESGNNYVGLKDIYKIIGGMFGIKFSEVKRICDYEYKYVNEFIESWDIDSPYDGVWLKNFGKFITNHYRLNKDENKEVNRDSQ